MYVQKEFEGERIKLVSMIPNHALMVFNALHDHSPSNLSFFKTPVNRQREDEWIENMASSNQDLVFLIFLKDENRIIGTIGLHEYDRANNNARLGLFIFKEADRKQGFGTESLKLLLDFAFNEFGLHKVYARILANSDHTSALTRFYVNIGFVFEGEMWEEYLLGGEYYDMASFSILKKKWEAIKKSKS